MNRLAGIFSSSAKESATRAKPTQENDEEVAAKADRDDDDREATNDILWSDCPEELYLRQILAERHQDEYTIVDSIMGQSTVAAIFSGNNNEQRHQSPGASLEEYDGRSWTDVGSIAGSFTTEGRTTLESSPSFSESTADGSLVSNPRQWEGSEEVPGGEEDGKDEDVTRNQEGVNLPRFLVYDEDDTFSLPGKRSIQDIIDAHKTSFDEEEVEFDHATGAGCSTLSGGTIFKYTPPQHDNAQCWESAENIKNIKAEESRTTQSTREEGNSNNSGISKGCDLTARIRSLCCMRLRETGSADQSREGCFTWLIRRLTDDDKVFRRAVMISVVFIIAFVTLSTVAFVKAGVISANRNPSFPMPPTASPTLQAMNPMP